MNAQGPFGARIIHTSSLTASNIAPMASWSVLQDSVLSRGGNVRRFHRVAAHRLICGEKALDDRLGTLVQAVVKRLIPLQQRPEPQEHESDTRYKARSGPPLPTTLGCYELRPTTLGHAVTELPPIIWSPTPASIGLAKAASSPVIGHAVRTRQRSTPVSTLQRSPSINNVRCLDHPSACLMN